MLPKTVSKQDKNTYLTFKINDFTLWRSNPEGEPEMNIVFIMFSFEVGQELT